MGKHHHKSKDKDRASSGGQSQTQSSSSWSEWLTDPETGNYYCWRTGTNGQPEYRYYEETPRSIPDSSASAGGNYTQNNTYGYSAPEDGQSQIGALTDRFASSSLNQPSYSASSTASTSYGASSNASTTYTAPSTVSTSYTAGSTTYATPITASTSSVTGAGGTPYSVSYRAPSYSANPGGYGQQTGQSGYDQYSTTAAGQSAPYVSNSTSSTSTGTYYPSTTSTSFAAPTGSQYPSTTDNLQTSNAYQGTAGGNVTQGPRITASQKNDFERRDPNFKVHHSKAFKPGLVLKVMWTEPRGETSYSNRTMVTEQHHETGRETIFTKIRRFVVTGVGNGYSLCVPILTYQNQATLKQGAKADEHAVVYVKNTPIPHVEGEEELPNTPIEITMNTPREKLEKTSRIHYAKTYTVEHNVRVNIIGNISSSSRLAFSTDMARVQGNINTKFD